MMTTGITIRKLRGYKLLNDKGLDLTRLKTRDKFGESLECMTAWAAVWEIARRYNLTYRNDPAGRWVFESNGDYQNEALWFAQQVITDWSGCTPAGMAEVQTNKPPGSPPRVGLTDPSQRGVLTWMVEKCARVVYRYLQYHVLHGRHLLEYFDDVDGLAKSRIIAGQNPPRPCDRYQPLQGRLNLVIAPTRLPVIPAPSGFKWRSKMDEEGRDPWIQWHRDYAEAAESLAIQKYNRFMQRSNKPVAMTVIPSPSEPSRASKSSPQKSDTGHSYVSEDLLEKSTDSPPSTVSSSQEYSSSSSGSSPASTCFAGSAALTSASADTLQK